MASNDEYQQKQFFDEASEIDENVIRAIIIERLERDFNNYRIIFGTSAETHLPKK